MVITVVMTVPGGVTLLGGPASVNAATGTYTASGINVSLSRIDSLHARLTGAGVPQGS